MLFQVDGHSHVVHSETEPTGTRLMIDSLTCLLSNETDPSSLRANSPGKLIKRLVEDGEHIAADQAFAEIEVRFVTLKPALTPSWKLFSGYHRRLMMNLLQSAGSILP